MLCIQLHKPYSNVQQNLPGKIVIKIHLQVNVIWTQHIHIIFRHGTNTAFAKYESIPNTESLESSPSTSTALQC
jgi:hypothetical protein